MVPRNVQYKYIGHSQDEPWVLSHVLSFQRTPVARGALPSLTMLVGHLALVPWYLDPHSSATFVDYVTFPSPSTFFETFGCI